MNRQRYYSVALDGEPGDRGSAQLFANEAGQGPATKFDNPELLDRVQMLKYGDYMLSGAEFGGLSAENLTARFVNIVDFGRSREDSVRDDPPISFGQLILKSEFDPEAAKLVAIKPFDTARQAIYEYEVTSYLNRLIEPPRAHSSFKLLGFYAFEQASGKTGLITEYDQGVISYDNVFYNREREPSRAEVQKALGYCGLGLGYLHSLGLGFRDSQIKNFAHGNNGVRYIDPESIRLMTGKRGTIDPLTADQWVTNDLSTLLRTINRFEDFSEEFVRDFLPVYMGMVRQPRSQLPEESRLTLDDARLYLDL